MRRVRIDRIWSAVAFSVLVLAGGAVSIAYSGRIAGVFLPDATGPAAGHGSNATSQAPNATSSTSITSALPTTTTPLPPASPSPPGACELQYRPQALNAPASQALDRFWELAGRANLSWERTCAHLHAWHDYLNEPNFAAYHAEAALLAGERASQIGDPGYAQRFFDVALEAPPEERLHAEVSAFARIDAWYGNDQRVAEDNQTLPVRVAAALHAVDAAFDAAESTGDATGYAYGLSMLDEILANTTDPIQRHVLRAERGLQASRIPLGYGVDARPDRLYDLDHTLGPGLNPRWSNHFNAHGAEDEMGERIRAEYARFYGTDTAYAHTEQAGRWLLDPIPYCVDPDVEPELAALIPDTLDAWRLAGEDRFTFRGASSCDDERQIVLTMGDAAGAEGQAATHRSNGALTGCRVTVQTGIPPGRWPGLLAHEVGHCLGLPHSPFESDLMSIHHARLDDAAIAARDAATLRTLWDHPILSLGLGRTGPLDPDPRLNGSQDATISWTIQANVVRSARIPVYLLYVDVDGDLKEDLRLDPGATTTWTFHRYGPHRVSLDIEPTFRSPARIDEEILVRR